MRHECRKVQVRICCQRHLLRFEDTLGPHFTGTNLESYSPNSLANLIVLICTIWNHVLHREWYCGHLAVGNIRQERRCLIVRSRKDAAAHSPRSRTTQRLMLQHLNYFRNSINRPLSKVSLFSYFAL